MTASILDVARGEKIPGGKAVDLIDKPLGVFGDILGDNHDLSKDGAQIKDLRRGRLKGRVHKFGGLFKLIAKPLILFSFLGGLTGLPLLIGGMFAFSTMMHSFKHDWREVRVGLQKKSEVAAVLGSKTQPALHAGHMSEELRLARITGLGDAQPLLNQVGHYYAQYKKPGNMPDTVLFDTAGADTGIKNALKNEISIGNKNAIAAWDHLKKKGLVG